MVDFAAPPPNVISRVTHNSAWPTRSRWYVQSNPHELVIDIQALVPPWQHCLHSSLQKLVSSAGSQEVTASLSLSLASQLLLDSKEMELVV